MTNKVISVEHLSKLYDLGIISTGTLTRDLERWWARIRQRPDPYTRIGQEDGFAQLGESILALDEVSFTVEQGETLGIIGRNGAGKSTLLKILSRVTAPSSGVVKVRGRIGSLLEVGTGFHPELTGRENVFLNGAILGMKKAEMTRKFDEIVAFSEVEKFIDTPVKRYSSGMYVRLAFAVAAHLEPEILIVDEVLAVGDAEFQKKCLGKMGEVAGEGRTVLFVSHNMASIQQLCQRTIMIQQGKIAKNGQTDEVISAYLANSSIENTFNPISSERLGDQRISVLDFGVNPQNPRTGQTLAFTFLVKAERETTADYSISFTTEYGQKIFQLNSGHMQHGINLKPGVSEIRAIVDQFPLTAGRYKLNLWIGSGNSLYDWIPEAYTLLVDPGTIAEDVIVDNHGYPVVCQSYWEQTSIKSTQQGDDYKKTLQSGIGIIDHLEHEHLPQKELTKPIVVEDQNVSAAIGSNRLPVSLFIRLWRRLRKFLRIKRIITIVLRYDDFSATSPLDIEENLVEICRQTGIAMTFGVIPFVTAGNVHDPSPSESLPLPDEKAELLRNWHSNGWVDIALHGFSHQTWRSEPYSEFAGVPEETQSSKIKQGKMFLETKTGSSVNKFIPPWNSYDEQTLKVLESLGFTAISGKRDAPVTPHSKLKYLPETCSVRRLRSAISSVRSSSSYRPIIVLVFHAFEFSEDYQHLGSLSIVEFAELIKWLHQQKDIRLVSIQQALDKIPGLNVNRFLQIKDPHSGNYQ